MSAVRHRRDIGLPKSSHKRQVGGYTYQSIMLSISLTDIPGGGAHHGLQLELCLQLGGGGQVEYPVVVDQSHQRPNLGVSLCDVITTPVIAKKLS